MTYELWVLALNAVILLLLYATQGGFTTVTAPAWGLGARDQTREPSVFADRAARTVRNQIEAVAVFAPLVIVAHLIGLSNSLTVWGAGMFLGSRVLFVPLYLLGVPYLRTLIWAVGFFGLIMIAYAVLTAGTP